MQNAKCKMQNAKAKAKAKRRRQPNINSTSTQHQEDKKKSFCSGFSLCTANGGVELALSVTGRSYSQRERWQYLKT